MLKGGVELGFRNAVKITRLLGEGLELVVVDEAQDIEPHDFYQTLYPMLEGVGHAVLAGTSRPGSWLWEHYETGQKDPEKIHSYKRPSRLGPIFQGPEGEAAFKKLWDGMTENERKQELECEPVLAQDAVFRHLDRVLVDTVPPSVPQAGRRCIAGYDIGRVRDSSFVTILDDTGLVVYTEQFPLGMLHEEQAKKIAKLVTDWRCQHSIVIDATKQGDNSGVGALGRYDRYIQFYRAALPFAREFYWSPANLEATISTVTLQIEQKRILIPRCHKVLVSQLRAYQYKYNGFRTSFGAPKGQHDDATASFIQVVYGFISGWFSTVGGHAGLALPCR